VGSCSSDIAEFQTRKKRVRLNELTRMDKRVEGISELVHTKSIETKQYESFSM